MPSGVFPIQNTLGIKAPTICYSGALILDEHGGCIKSVGIEDEKAAEVDATIKKEWKSICCSVFSHDDWIVSDVRNPWVVREHHITLSEPTEGSLSDLIAAKRHIHKFLCMGDAGQITDIDNELNRKFPDLTVYRSKDTYLEIMNGAASKSGAVGYLCEDYGIPTELAVSFGDNYNDVDMLRATGVGFAMGNAPEGVKRQTQYVTLDNDNEGVLAGLNQLDFA